MNKHILKFTLVAILALTTGCTSDQPSTLAADHPANPTARESSTTLSKNTLAEDATTKTTRTQLDTASHENQ